MSKSNLKVLVQTCRIEKKASHYGDLYEYVRNNLALISSARVKEIRWEDITLAISRDLHYQYSHSAVPNAFAQVLRENGINQRDFIKVVGGK